SPVVEREKGDLLLGVGPREGRKLRGARADAMARHHDVDRAARERLGEALAVERNVLEPHAERERELVRELGVEADGGAVAVQEGPGDRVGVEADADAAARADEIEPGAARGW